MNIDELLKHQHIGIDLDGTLIEHPRSAVLQQFILDHQGSKKFHIVTFRSHGLEDRIDADLYASTMLTGVPLRLEHFTGIHAVPYRLYEGWALRSDNAAYFGWKAQKCKELGCTVLIDDMIDSIHEHCTVHGIVGLNPDHF